jgi:hypothetical protein
MTLPQKPFRSAELRRALAAAAGGVALLSLSWGLLHVGFYGSYVLSDTPRYWGYGFSMQDGQIPYRDFVPEYPPGAMPIFFLPTLGTALTTWGNDVYGAYGGYFEALVWLCAVAAIACAALTLTSLGASSRRLYGAVAFIGLAPLLLGTVVISRFDLWPAALTSASVAAVVAVRYRLGAGLLGLAVAAKLYPLVLLPLVIVHVASVVSLK